MCFALIQKRASLQHRIRFNQHFAEIFESFASAVTDPVKIINMAQIHQHAGDVFWCRDVVQLNGPEKTAPHQSPEQRS